MTYKPQPADTSDVILGSSLENLIEALAENTHDNWATQRISDGWQFGKERDDTNKLHPDLIPYSDLSESEKEYDRRTAMESIRLLIKLGYRVERA